MRGEMSEQILHRKPFHVGDSVFTGMREWLREQISVSGAEQYDTLYEQLQLCDELSVAF